MFAGELVIKAGNICSTIDEGMCVNDFHSMQGYDNLQRNSHRFGLSSYSYTHTMRRGRLC